MPKLIIKIFNGTDQSPIIESTIVRENPFGQQLHLESPGLGSISCQKDGNGSLVYSCNLANIKSPSDHTLWNGLRFVNMQLSRASLDLRNTTINSAYFTVSDVSPPTSQQIVFYRASLIIGDILGHQAADNDLEGKTDDKISTSSKSMGVIPSVPAEVTSSSSAEVFSSSTAISSSSTNSSKDFKLDDDRDREIHALGPWNGMFIRLLQQCRKKRPVIYEDTKGQWSIFNLYLLRGNIYKNSKAFVQTSKIMLADCQCNDDKNDDKSGERDFLYAVYMEGKFAIEAALIYYRQAAIKGYPSAALQLGYLLSKCNSLRAAITNFQCAMVLAYRDSDDDTKFAARKNLEKLESLYPNLIPIVDSLPFSLESEHHRIQVTVQAILGQYLTTSNDEARHRVPTLLSGEPTSSISSSSFSMFSHSNSIPQQDQDQHIEQKETKPTFGSSS